MKEMLLERGKVMGDKDKIPNEREENQRENYMRELNKLDVERERKRERQTERETQTQRERETNRERDTERERQTERHTEREREKETDRQREGSSEDRDILVFLIHACE